MDEGAAPASMFMQLLARYRDAIAATCPVQPSGPVLPPFPRLFIAGTR